MLTDFRERGREGVRGANIDMQETLISCLLYAPQLVFEPTT